MGPFRPRRRSRRSTTQPITRQSGNMRRKPGKAAAWLPFLRFTPMRALIPIRIRPAHRAPFLPLSLLALTGFAGAQAGPATSPTEAAQYSIPLLTQEQMTPGDRAAAQSLQPAIAESALFYGYKLNSSFTYREIACPVAPNDLLLAYETTSPSGSISRFTAVVRRRSEEERSGRHPTAQIIPILHFGVIPFVPAIANPHSIEVFNAAVSDAPSATEVLSAGQAGNQPLLVRSLCYLAMVGEEPAAIRSPGLDSATIHAPVPALVFEERGKIQQLISVRSAPNSYQVWALTFQAGGKLLSATREQHPIDRTPIVLNAVNNGSPAPATTNIAAGAGQVSSQPQVFSQPTMPPPSAPSASTAAAIPVAPAELTAPAPVRPAPTAASAAITAPATPPPAATSRMGGPTTPAAPKAPAMSAEIPQPPVEPAENTTPVTEPVTESASSPAASTVQPISPATPAMAAPPTPPPSPSVPTAPAPTATSATMEAPQPTSPPAAPASATIPAVAVAAATAMATPAVKPPPPLPPGRFIANPPQPPSRFIPDSALKNPPHLPQ